MDFILIIAYLISVALPLVALYVIFLLDMFGTGKGNTVMVCLVWGFAFSFGLAYLVNVGIQDNFGVDFQTLSTSIAPIVEEIIKALILLYFIQQPRFRYFVDGAIYGYAAGIGFAITENIYYVATNPTGADGVLILAFSRGLSSALMHGAASAVVGISLGLSRRSHGIQKYLEPLLGFAFAMGIHWVYNNALFALATTAPFILLLVGVGIGLTGAAVIAFFIRWGLNVEKERFTESLAGSRVSKAEQKALQAMGSDAIEKILEEMAMIFGEAKATMIQELLVLQANIGILKNNLRGSAGERLRKAWEKEVAELNIQMDALRNKLGTYVMTLLRSFLPDDESSNWNEFSQSMASFDPMHVHTFDLFLMASDLAGTLTPEKIEELANRLKGISIFQNVELGDLDNLSRAVQFKRYKTGDLLFDMGDSGDYMYLIEDGYIDISLPDVSGSETLLRTYQTGDVVGELALLDGQPRSARARANGDLKVMVLQRQHLLMFLQSRARVILAILSFLADRVRYTTDAVTDKAENITVVHKEKSADSEREELVVQALDIETLGVFKLLAGALAKLES